jgi:hypothetical protein
MAVQVEQSLTLMKTQMAGLQVAPAVPVAIVVTPNVVVR